MASKKPLVVGDELEQLQPGDALTIGDYDIPNTLGANGTILQVDAGAATWDTFGNILLSDGDYYVDITGNDSDDGSVGSPWLTLEHAIDEIYKVQFEHVGKVTVHLSDGVHTVANTVNISNIHPNLLITGENDALEVAATEIDVVTDIGGGVYDLKLSINSSTGLTTNQYAGIREVTPKGYVNGGWEIRAIDDATHITIRIVSPNVIPAVGLFTGTLRIPKTILIISCECGLWIENTSVHIEHVTFVADGATYAIRLFNVYNSTIGEQVIINNFVVGVGNHAKLVFDKCYITQCPYGVGTDYSAFSDFRDCVFAACAVFASSVYSGVAIHDGCDIVSNGVGIQGDRGSIVTGTNTYVFGNTIGAALYYMSLGTFVTNMTYVSNGTDKTPATGEGNFNSYMNP